MPFYDSIIKISSGPDGARPDDSTFNSGMNDDGSFVFVSSFATNLAPDDPNGFTLSPLVYDVAEDEFRYLGTSATIHLSQDKGHYTFNSFDGTLVPNSPPGNKAFVADTETGAINLLSIFGTDGELINSSASVTSVANGGQLVAFWSRATNLVDGFTSTNVESYVHNVGTGATTLISPGVEGAEPDRSVSGAVLSGNGQIAAYTSSATNLVAGDINNLSDVFMFNFGTGAVTRISEGAGGVGGNGASSLEGVSADGTKIAFTSDASNLVAGDTNGLRDLFLYDVASGSIQRLGEGPNGEEPDGVSYSASFSTDGRFVAFTSAATNIVAGSSFADDAYVTNLVTGETALVSMTYRGQQANRDSGDPKLSGDGQYITYTSMATNLIDGAARDFYWDVFRVENPLYERPNTPPESTFDETPDPVWHGQQVYLDVGRTFSDDDDDDLTFRAENLPNGLRISEDLGIILGTVDHTDPIEIKSVRITADDGRGGTKTVEFDWQVSAPRPPSDFLKEYIARQTAYAVGDNITEGRLSVGDHVLDPNGVETGYRVNRIWDVKAPVNDQQGFIAVGLTGEGLQPVIGVRGSFSDLDIFFADTDPRGVGVTQFETAWNDTSPAGIRHWVETREDQGIAIVGHSLGGAQSQLLAAYATDADMKVASVTTYNSPGVPTFVANMFDAALAGQVNHRVSSGDIVSMAGNAFIDGTVTLYDLTTYDPDSTTSVFDLVDIPTGAYLAPLFYLLHAHVDQWSQPDMYFSDFNGATTLRDGEPVILGEFSASDLGAPGYTHLRNVANPIDAEFMAFLLSLTLAGNFVGSASGNANLGGDLAAALLRREDAEAERVEIGKMVRELEAFAGNPTSFSEGIINVLSAKAGAIAQAAANLSLAPSRVLTEAILDFGGQLWTQLANLGAGFWGAVGTFSQSLLDQFLSAPARFWDRVSPFNTEAWKTVTDWTAAQWAEADGWSDVFWSQIGDWSDSIWATIRSAPFTTLQEVAALPLAALQTIGQFGSAMLSALFEAGTSISESTINALSGLPSLVFGSDAGDMSSGTDARESFDTGLGDDTVAPGGGFDDIKLGSGDDVVRGSAEDLNGDRISDFTDDDRLELLGLLLDLTDLKITLGSADLSIDTDGDGSADTFVRLLGDFAVDDFTVSHEGGNTIIRTIGAANGFNQLGTDVADLIDGSNGNDTINGGAGDDRLNGRGGDDLLIGGPGSDVIYVDSLGDRVSESRSWSGQDVVISSVDFRMGRKHIEDLTLEGAAIVGAGNGLRNRITGNEQDNILDGGKNNDTLVGGAGNDTYILRAPGDTIIERAGAGNDVAKSYGSFALMAHVDRLFMQTVYSKNGDPVNFNGIGNGLDNTIIGTPFDNTIVGREGRDTLKGQAGADTFVFDRAIGPNNVDRIIDFNTNTADEGDILKLKGSLFGGLTAGVLDAGAFAAGPTALDANDRFVFDRASGQLWFDGDGSGAGAQVLIARFEQNAALTSDDMVIF